jgi:uncharacterized protein YabN with tetrapyrrole methylase and pyrophosphatase domain
MRGHASLVIVGFGIKFLSHLTTEAKAYIEKSDKILYLVNDPAVKDWLQKMHKCTESLDQLYQSQGLRSNSYQAIADYILETVRQGQHVCVVLYGHPTVFAQPGIIAVNQARKEGLDARILPGISAEDCLFSDLLVNPGSCGCQSYEATDFLVYDRPIHTASHLIIWQAGFIGALGHLQAHDNQIGIKLLHDTLAQQYPPTHKVTLYEAAQYPHFEPRIEQIELQDLINAKISAITTLYIPPLKKARQNQSMLAALHIKTSLPGS